MSDVRPRPRGHGKSTEHRLLAELEQPQVLAYIAALLAWREGDELPQRPVQLRMTLVELMAHLGNPETRRAIVERLSVLVPAEGRQLSRAERRRRR